MTNEQKYYADGTEYDGDAAPGTTIIRKISCWRCGGTGIYSSFHGACFSCNGVGYKPKKARIYSAEQLEKKNAAAAKRKRTKEEKLARRIAATRVVSLDAVEGGNLAHVQATMILSNAGVYSKYVSGYMARLKSVVEDPREWSEDRARYMVDLVKEITTKQAEIDQRARSEDEMRKDPSMWIMGGRYQIEGEVLSCKEQFTEYGITRKMLVQNDDGQKFWGTVPRSISMQEGDKGMRVRFTATVQRSDKDPIFGTYKRPAKAEVVQA